MRLVAKRLGMGVGLMAMGLAVAATAAFARDDDDGWKHHKHRGPHFVPPGHVYYVVPAPMVYVPPRIYREPAYYGREPGYYGPPTPSLNINIPLR